MNGMTTHGTLNRRLGASLLSGLALVGLTVTLAGCTPTKPTAAGGEVRADAKPSWFRSQIGEQLEPLELKIEDWEAKEATIKTVLTKLDKDRQNAIKNLRDAGVTSSKDLKDNPKGQVYARELQEVDQQIAAVQKKDQEHQEAIESAKATLRSVERELLVKKASGSDEEVANLRTLIMDLDQKLAASDQAGPGVDLKLDATVDKELQAPKKP